MNRGEAINQLNLDRKRRENDVWQRWFLAETKRETTPGKLLDRTNELNKIRDDYDRTLQRLNQQSFEETPESRQRTEREVNRPTNTTPRVRPNTQNTPENQTTTPGQEVRSKSNITQIQNQKEPNVVRQARKANIQEEIDSENDFDPNVQNTTQTEQEKPQAAKKAYKLSTIECFVLVILGLLTDLINLIPFVNILVTALIAPCFTLYFRARGVFIAPTIIAAIVEFIPAISVLPATTLGIVITILFDRFGGKVLKDVPVISKLVQK